MLGGKEIDVLVVNVELDFFNDLILKSFLKNQHPKFESFY